MVGKEGRKWSTEASDSGLPGDGGNRSESPEKIPSMTNMQRRFFFLFLAWTLVNLAQARRQRVSELSPEKQRPTQETPPCSSARVRSPAPPAQDCLLPPLLPLLLPCGLLVGLLAALALYFYKREKDASADSDPDDLLDEALIRDISGVLYAIRFRLCQIMQDRKKVYQHFPNRSRPKSR